MNSNYVPHEGEIIIQFDTEKKQEFPLNVALGKVFSLQISGIKKWYLWNEGYLSKVKPLNLSFNSCSEDYYPIYSENKSKIIDAFQFLKFEADEPGTEEITIADDSMEVGYEPNICTIKIKVE
jgi:hypothetical protein